MVASETAKLSIIRRARDPKAYITSRYGDARNAITGFLADRRRSLSRLATAEQAMNQRLADPSTRAKKKEDASLSIEVLHAIQGMQNQLAGYDFQPAPARQDKLHIAGVDISVKADLLVHGRSGKADHLGAALLRMTKDDATTDMAQDRRKRMGQYSAMLVYLHVMQNLDIGERTPKHTLCIAIDVQHGAIFHAPRNYKQRQKDIESACIVIAGLWDQL